MTMDCKLRGPFDSFKYGNDVPSIGFRNIIPYRSILSAKLLPNTTMFYAVSDNLADSDNRCKYMEVLCHEEGFEASMTKIELVNFGYMSQLKQHD